MILIVDNDPRLAESRQRRFEQAGYACLTVSSVHAALGELDGRPAIELAMLAHEVAASAEQVGSLRSARPELLIVGHGDAQHAGAFRALGIGCFLREPWSLDEFRALVTREASPMASAVAQLTVERPATKASLLNAAEELFSERGYDAVRTREIAALAGANVSSIKYHFGSKRGLYVETIRSLLLHPDVNQKWDAFESLPSTQEGAATVLFAFVRGALQQALDGGRPERCVRLMLQESLQPGEDFEFIIETFSAPYERLMIGLVRAIAPGRSEVFYVTSGRSIFAQFLHYYVWKPYLARSEYGTLGGTIPVQDAANDVAQLILRGLGCSQELIDRAQASPPPSPPGDDLS